MDITNDSGVLIIIFTLFKMVDKIFILYLIHNAFKSRSCISNVNVIANTMNLKLCLKYYEIIFLSMK